MSVLGYCILTIGLCLILHPTASDVAAAAVFGVVVGVLRTLASTRANLQVLMPVLAAFVVSVLAATAVDHDWISPALRAVVASLVVFLPGATLTTAVLELAAGQIVSGASRLVAGAVQLALLAFGILAGVEAVGVSSSLVLTVGGQRLGDWAPWLGVLVFAVGVATAHSAPKWALPMLLVVLYTAWIGQLVGNIVLGGYVSAFVGAAAMTPVAYLVGRHPPAMPARASFLPGFWLLVPGALGLIGLTELAGDVGIGRHERSRGDGVVDLRRRHRRAVRHHDDRRCRVDQGVAHQLPGERRTPRAVATPIVEVTARRAVITRSNFSSSALSIEHMFDTISIMYTELVEELMGFDNDSITERFRRTRAGTPPHRRRDGRGGRGG